ncbi:FAD-dependent monooxygenase, partial [Streptomyces sp. NPDC094034]|uniref:FAD-dependent monooxygenase n=1 Tax=Streptomyces sp. NPDC094034 TaxID=3155309 RepID=UPI003329F36D
MRSHPAASSPHPGDGRSDKRKVRAMASETEVVVVGAGPVGLTLAIELARRRVD